MKNKKWLRSVAFILLLSVAVMGVMQIYGLPKTYDTRNIAAFDAEQEKLVDGVVLGTSVVAHSWLTPVAWQDYGVAIYHLSTSVQPFGIVPEYLDYVQKTQDIKYAIIDIHGLRTEAILSGLRPAKFRAAYLNIPDMESRFKVLKALNSYVQEVYDFYGKPESESNTVDLEDKSYLIPFINFHRRWVDGLKKADYVTVSNRFMGANDRDNSFGVMDCSEFIDRWNFKLTDEIDDFQKGQLQEIFDYAAEKDIELVFINIPSFRSKSEQKEMSEIIEYCKSKGYDTIDFTDSKVFEESGISLSEDFLNKGHLNARGGVKVTKYICEFLIENGYYYTDHRVDEAYIHWHTTAEKYNSFYEKGWAESKA
ncbi:MAG: hypothetical protein IJ491_01660 [Clostridia bacterium]|nr:hypothetical protein [Clostridia bacterium]